MKRLIFALVVTFFALFCIEARAQMGSPLDTLTTINGIRLVSYTSGVHAAGTRFDNASAAHGIFSQWLWVERLSPNHAGERAYTATFQMKLKKRLKVGEFMQFRAGYVHSKPVVDGYSEIPVLDVAFECDGVKSNFYNILFNKNDNWGTNTFLTKNFSVRDSVDNIYFRVSGNGKNTYIQLDYFVFSDPTTEFVYDIINDFEDSTIVDVEKTPELPTGYSLSQNYPNPFNPETAISYQLSAFSHVTLKVYDILGREMATLVNEEKSAGRHTAKFNASNLASGTYFYQIIVDHGKFSQVKKMMLVK